MSDAREMRIETRVVHGGVRRPGPEGSVVYPIYQGTVFDYGGGSGYHDIQYIRLNTTPSQRHLHDRLAALEGSEAALGTASGMAAITASLMSFLSAGDHFLAEDTLYGGTYDFITQRAEGLGLSYTLVDAARPGEWRRALRPETRLFYLETISNPLMRVPDLEAAAAFAREHRLVSVIDNTFATPVNFQPLALGFDLSLHSATKYLNGHSDLVAGAVMGSAEHVEKVRRSLNLLGGTLDPHAGYLLDRGIKTLALRVQAQNRNAAALAGALAEHPAVATVNFPGLPGHPDHAHARKALRGFGGMLSFRLRGGVAAAERMLGALQLPHVAPSLGGVETLVTRPATSSHAGLSPEDRERCGVTDDLVRVSVGIESSEDLIADFHQALERG